MFTFCAYYLLALVILSALVGPFSIGKPRDPSTAGAYVAGLILSAPHAALALHVLGVW